MEVFADKTIVLYNSSVSSLDDETQTGNVLHGLASAEDELKLRTMLYLVEESFQLTYQQLPAGLSS